MINPTRRAARPQSQRGASRCRYHGTICSERVAADLTGNTLEEIRQQVADGLVRTESSRGERFIFLDDVLPADRPAPVGGGT